MASALRQPPDDTVDLWAALPGGVADAAEAVEQLAPDERTRAAQLSGQTATAFVMARAFLRQVAGRYLQRPPADVAFVYGRYGRPDLRSDPDSPAPPSISLSHSRDLIVVAVAAAPVGVDTEARDRQGDDQDLRRCLTPVERFAIDAQPASQRREALLIAWTRKEAVAKAMGLGLHLPFDGIGAGTTIDDRFLRLAPPGERAEEWTVLSELLCGAIVSVAVRARAARTVWRNAPHAARCHAG